MTSEVNGSWIRLHISGSSIFRDTSIGANQIRGREVS